MMAEIAAEELFRTADTVLAVSPTRSATDRNVGTDFLLTSVFSLPDFINGLHSANFVMGLNCARTALRIVSQRKLQLARNMTLTNGL